MNYIRHQNGVTKKIDEDDRLNPTHVSMYFALFSYWNLNRFINPMIIIRGEIMKLSKIGSANTYTKCIKDLHKYGYLKYYPSNSPFQCSQVFMFNFENNGEHFGRKSDNSSVIVEDNYGRNSDNSTVTVVRSNIKHNKPIKPKRKNSHVNNFKDYSEPL